jgi:flagellar motor switch protein FliM
VVYEQLEDAWAHICPIKIKQVSLETNPQFVQIVPPGETVIVVSFQLKLFQSTGLMTICYPYMALEGIINKLSAQNWIDATKKKSREHDTDVNRINLMELAVPLTAVLARTDVTIADFLSMRVGDIITTNQRIDHEIEVLVRNRRKLLARPGLVGRKRGLVVSEVLQDLGKE